LNSNFKFKGSKLAIGGRIRSFERELNADQVATVCFTESSSGNMKT
jgi:hypothetical protein